MVAPGGTAAGSSNGRIRVVIVAEKYLPGWKAGGPIRSLSNLVEQLGDEYDFRLITEDRDRDDREPYPGIRVDTWARVGKALVFYGTRKSLRYTGLVRTINGATPDLVYHNSILSRLTIRHLVWRRLHAGHPSAPVLISPRGELDTGALSIRPIRKRAYLLTGRLLGLFRGVTWQATTPIEAAHIAASIPGAVITTAGNLVTAPPASPPVPPTKRPGSARIAFVSRIGPKKNLPYLLRALRRVEGEVELEIHGRKLPAEWAAAEQVLAKGLAHVAVSYHGTSSHEEVDRTLERIHFLALPTLGESFGHAVYEALRLGRPVIVSDRTPWRGLTEAHAGWDLPLEAETAWVEVLQRCVDMDEPEYRDWSAGAHAAAYRWHEMSTHAEDQRIAFTTAMHLDAAPDGGPRRTRP